MAMRAVCHDGGRKGREAARNPRAPVPLCASFQFGAPACHAAYSRVGRQLLAHNPLRGVLAPVAAARLPQR